jgi:hypothetical protein
LATYGVQSRRAGRDCTRSRENWYSTTLPIDPSGSALGQSKCRLPDSVLNSYTQDMGLMDVAVTREPVESQACIRCYRSNSSEAQVGATGCVVRMRDIHFYQEMPHLDQSEPIPSDKGVPVCPEKQLVAKKRIVGFRQ